MEPDLTVRILQWASGHEWLSQVNGILLAKLHNCDINGIDHDIFRSYLITRKPFCKVKGAPSKIQSIEIGVP